MMTDLPSTSATSTTPSSSSSPPPPPAAITEPPPFSEDAVLPQWAESLQETWGSRLTVEEWDKGSEYRRDNGWKGQDLIHSKSAAVRLFDYYLQPGNGAGIDGLEQGGVGTKLTGVVYYSPAAESHKGFCHGGSMCSLMDDIIGWCGFVVTGTCHPWSGFTVQINTSLRKPIPVGSFLVASAEITKIERRKVSIRAKLFAVQERDGTEVLHAEGDGLVVLNRGVLPSAPAVKPSNAGTN